MQAPATPFFHACQNATPAFLRRAASRMTGRVGPRGASPGGGYDCLRKIAMPGATGGLLREATVLALPLLMLCEPVLDRMVRSAWVKEHDAG